MKRKSLKNVLKQITRKLGFEIRRYFPEYYGKELITLKPGKKECHGYVLLSYCPFGRIDHFSQIDGEMIPVTHTNYWESLQIARTFLDLGYTVDVISYLNKDFIPKKKYSFFVGACINFEKFAQVLNEDCVKIVHIDTAHWLFNNSAAYNRCLALQQRRGVTLNSYKMVEPNWAIDYADFATVLGNEFTMNTYKYAGKDLYRVPISTCAVYPWPEDKDFVSCNRNFLWFGSRGLVHKGLDLVLEAIAGMPDYHLTVCGPLNTEKDFEKAFYKELYQTPNIRAVGWVDVNSQAFIDIMNTCVGVIYPSCSEGGGGAVINCIHGGLIPIVSYETGIDVMDFGIILKDCSIDKIKNALKEISSLPAAELKSMAHRAWKFARKYHTRERFAEEYRKAIIKITEVCKKDKHTGPDTL